MLWLICGTFVYDAFRCRVDNFNIESFSSILVTRVDESLPVEWNFVCKHVSACSHRNQDPVTELGYCFMLQLSSPLGHSKSSSTWDTIIHQPLYALLIILVIH